MLTPKVLAIGQRVPSLRPSGCFEKLGSFKDQSGGIAITPGSRRIIAAWRADPTAEQFQGQRHARIEFNRRGRRMPNHWSF